MSRARRCSAPLLKKWDWDKALQVAEQQVSSGANLLDVNFDEPLLDGPEFMRRFLNLISAEPEIARIPMVVDSSDWKVLTAGLKCVQGKGLVNSLSLKDGEEEFKRRAREVHELGAAMIVMAFDENGQAATADEKVRICTRAYKILTKDLGFDPQDIVFDPNILAICTGIAEHNGYAKAFIDAIPQIKAACPGARISGWRQQFVVWFSRQQSDSRSPTHSFSLSRDSSGPRHGHCQCGHDRSLLRLGCQTAHAL